MSTMERDSAQLEREVEAQRRRVEDRIGEIRERLSPGQLVDELLSYSKNGGQQFASNFASQISSNPIPAALLGVSLVWLMSGKSPTVNMGNHQRDTSYSSDYDSEYPYATVTGGLRRVSHEADDAGTWYSHFEDTSGKRYKAESNKMGHRVGEFVDDTGRKLGGFIDETGHRVRDFKDEAGNRLDEAMGWASHRMRDLKHGIGQAIGQVGDAVGQLGGHAQNLGGSTKDQLDRTNRMIMDTFQNQPLVAGALAFAAGAALGAALPSTREEDRLVGEVADKVRSKAAEVASDVYEEGKSRAADLYQRGKEGASEIYDDLRDKPGTRSSTELH